MKELIKKLRRYEIKIRKAVNNHTRGDFHSIFKGSGLEFDDVRTYQYGDEVRTIDWNISAKGHGTFVKTFREEKEQTLFFILDVSASQHIGSSGKTKFDISKEICGVLALSGARESNQLGLICYSDQREQYIKPKKGLTQAYEIIYSLAKLQPKSLKTDLGKAFSFASNVVRRKSVIVVISDFIDADYKENLRPLAKRHDLILIHLQDNREVRFPKLGIVQVRDKENKKNIWVNTSFGNFRDYMIACHENRKKDMHTFSMRHQINFLSINTAEDYVPQLLKLFKVRNMSMKNG